MEEIEKNKRRLKRTIWASSALLVWGGAFEAGAVAAEGVSARAPVASILPDPGEDWILRASEGEKKDGGDENDRSALASVAAEGVRATAHVASILPDPGEDWILRASEGEKKDGGDDDGRSALASVAAVGKIVAVDSTGIATEERRRDRRERTPRRPGDAILFLPPVDPSAAEAFCVEIWETPGDRNRDRFWLRNGDEFDGELLKIDRRRVWIRAFDVEFAVPRGRVRAVRFAEDDKKGEIGEE